MKIGHYAGLGEILNALEERHSSIHQQIVNLRDFKVRDNRHFEVNGLELFVEPKDDHPVKQLCSNIAMSLGFYKSNPGALNTQIFETRLRHEEDLRHPGDDEDKKKARGERLIRYRTLPDNRNQLLAILPVQHQSFPYVDLVRPLIQQLQADNAVIRESNHSQVDRDHRFHLRATFPQYKMNVQDNDPLEMGMFIDWSEDGIGRGTMTSMLYRLVCENGAMATFDSHPYFEYNYRGIRSIDLGAAMNSAIGRFGEDLQFVHSRCIESSHVVMTKDQVDGFLRDLEVQRNVSAGFLRKVRKELVSKTLPSLTRWDLVNEITQQAQTLPHSGRLQYEYLGGRLLGLNLQSESQ